MKMDIPISELAFVFLDTETTGLSPEFGDRMCEIALLKTKNGEILDSYQSLINPGRMISPGASAVNGITDEMVQGKPYFKDIIDDFMRIIDNSVLVIHNAPFDLSFLSTQFRILQKPVFDNPVIDSLFLARKYYRFPSNRLSAIGECLQIQINQLHRAYGDVAILKGIFDSFLNDFQEKGVSTLEDLLALQGGSIHLPKPMEIILPPQLEEAIASHKSIQLRYLDSQGHQSKRKVEPIDVTVSNEIIYLVAHCHLRNDQRTFRLDRIIEMEIIS